MVDRALACEAKLWWWRLDVYWQEHRRKLEMEGPVGGRVAQTPLWPSGRSPHPEEKALDVERLHESEREAWLGRAWAPTPLLGGFPSHSKFWPLH